MTHRISGRITALPVLVIVASAILVVPVVRAVDSPIPIDRPTVITTSGAYVVTKDFSAASGSAITVLGTITVDIDFAGHTVGATGRGGVMLRQNLGDDGCPAVTLHSGRMVNGWAYSVTAHGRCGVRLDITKMTLENSDVWIEDGTLTVTSNRLINSDMVSWANFGPAGARYEDNEVIAGDLMAAGVPNALIRHNRIKAGSIVIKGGDLPASGNRVEENNVIGGNITAGAGYLDVSGAIRGNFVTGAISIKNGWSLWVAGNYVGGCGQLGAGISVQDSRYGLLEKNNLVGSCPYGITFDSATRGNVYRNNVVENVTSASIVDQGEGNIDGGGNTAIIEETNDFASFE